jgi:ribosomal protein S12 methylthiotransferase accessory factor
MCGVTRMNQGDMQYKDELPINTINKIRGILGELGILTIETSWKNSIEGFYSVSLVIPNTCLTTNGKGTSYEYALASAYGELMERLQNQAAFRLGFDLSQETLSYLGFYYAPDEINMSIEEVINSNEDWLSKQMSWLKPTVDKQELLKLWQAVSYEDVPGDFIALPYLNIGNNCISHIPIKMISKMYMSNGMCAGNTLEEALVQGISEIMERNVITQVVSGKFVPPTIPHEYIEKFPKLQAMLSGIETSGNFNVIIKDCSFNQGFPVVGVIFINKSDQSYFVKFGAHPIFEIALERTLTELLQGQDIHKMMGVREFSYNNDTYEHPENKMGILVNGSGVYPTAFFSGDYNNQFQGFLNACGASNRELLIYLVNVLAQHGYDVFVRDVSYLGFPSFHIIVPGVSEIEGFDDLKAIMNYAEYNKVKKLIRNLGKLRHKEAKDIIELLQKSNYSHEVSVLDLLQLPTNGNAFPWYYANIDLFIMALYYRNRDFTNAYAAFSKFLSESTVSNSGAQVYHKCVRDYIGTRIDQLDDEKVINLLSAFYPQYIMQGVISEFKDSTQIISDPERLNCWNCENCAFTQHCLYQSTEKIYKKLKMQYATHPLNQSNFKARVALAVERY